MVPSSVLFDQSVLHQLLDVDPVVQDYRCFFADLDWSRVQQWRAQRSSRGRPAHPESAYLKAFLVRLREGMSYTSQLRRFLLKHPLLVIELGFHLALDPSAPYGFDCQRTLPSDQWLREKLRTFDQDLLQALLAATVSDLQEVIPGLGDTVAFDVKHIFAWVRENNPNVYVKDSFTSRTFPKVILTADLASRKVATRCNPMAPRKRKRSASLAMAPASLRVLTLSMAMWCWPSTPCPSMQPTSPIFVPSSSAPSSRSVSTLRILPLMLPMISGTSTRRWHIAKALLPSHSTRMDTKRYPAILMAPRTAPKACACTRSFSSGTPTATAHSAFAVLCSSPSEQARSVTTSSSRKPKAVSKISIGRKAA